MSPCTPSVLNDELQGLAARIAPSVVKIEVSGLNAVSDLATPNASFITKESSVGSGIALQLERDGKLQYLAFTNPD